MREERCENCGLWEKSDDPEKKDFGICHANAPRPAVISQIGTIEATYTIVWPMLGKDDWCGQWKSR